MKAFIVCFFCYMPGFWCSLFEASNELSNLVSFFGGMIYLGFLKQEELQKRIKSNDTE